MNPKSSGGSVTQQVDALPTRAESTMTVSRFTAGWMGNSPLWETPIIPRGSRGLPPWRLRDEERGQTPDCPPTVFFRVSVLSTSER